MSSFISLGDGDAGKRDEATGKSAGTTGKSVGTTGKRDEATGKSVGTTGKRDEATGKSAGTTGKRDEATEKSAGTTGKSVGTTGKRDEATGKSVGTTGKRDEATEKRGGTTGKSAGTTGKSAGTTGKRDEATEKRGGTTGKSAGTTGKSAGTTGKSAGTTSRSWSRWPPSAYRLLLLVLVTVFLPAACSSSPPPASSITVLDCTVAAIPGLTQAPVPPKPIDTSGSVVAAGVTVGALAGSGSVTPAGEYHYRIPLDVPPGRAGMAPSLALTYSSRGKNGHLGVGWQIEGLSEIDRCPRTLAVDHFSDGVRLDEHDAFCLDGHELVALGPYAGGGCTGTEYRTEDDTFARIVSCDGDTAIASFRVFSKDGRIRGYTPVQISSASSLAVLPGDNPVGGTVDFAWLLSTDQDRAGNSIGYTYGQEVRKFGEAAAIEYYPKEIDYTFQGATAAQRSIRFGYGPPGFVRPDPSFSYVQGVRVNVTKRLATIEAWAPNPTTPEKVWHYDLTYDVGQGSGASILTQVQRCGALGGCLPAKQFGWQSTVGAAYDTIPLQHGGLSPGSVPIVLDLDGDGRDDVLYTDLSGTNVVMTTTNPSHPLAVGSAPAGALGAVDLTTARPIDLDGDGRDELILPGTVVGYDVYKLGSPLITAAPTFTKSYIPVPGLDPSHPTPAYFADLDGDGLPDLITGAAQSASSSAWSWSFQLNRTGHSFWPAVPIANLNVAPLMVDGVPSSFATDQGQHRATVYFGTTDTGPTAGELLVLRLDAQGHPQVLNAPATTPIDAPSTAPTAFADLNGDGLHEQVTAEITASTIGIVVTGDNWPGGIENPFIAWPGEAIDETQVSLQVADVDGDGRDDVIVSYRGSLPPVAWVVRLGASGKLEQAKLAAPPPDAIGDFDGDGLIDLAACENGTWTLYRQKKGTSDQLTSVSDAGSAAAREMVTYSTTFSEAPAAAPEPPAPSACEHPQRCMRHGFSVVHERDVYQGSAYQRQVYDYDGARFDVHGRGFLGFGTVRQWEPDRLAETVTTYDNVTRDGGADYIDRGVYPNAGHPQRIRRAVLLPGAGHRARIAELDFTYQLEPTNQGKTWFVHPSAWTSYEWEQAVTVAYGDAAEHITDIDAASPTTALRVRDGLYTFDEYGNVLDSSVHTTNGVTTTTVTTYEKRPDDWLIGLVQSRRVISESAGEGMNAVTRRMDYTYDARGFLCHAYVDQDDDDPSMIEAFTYAYDGDGQPEAVTASSAGQPMRTTHVAYDTTERIFPVETWNDLGHAAWSVHDPALGVLAASEDANGARTTYAYDDLGRLLARTPEGGDAMKLDYAPRLDTSTGDVIGTTVLGASESGTETRTDTDVLGRAVAGGHLAFDGTWIEAARKYDVLGRVVAVARPGFGAPQSAATIYAYDGLDRLMQVTSPDQKVTTVDSTFFKTTTTDPLGHVRRVERDADDRVVKSLGVTAQGSVTTAYAYGDFNQLETTTDAEGNVVRVQYDRRGRRTRVDDPDAGFRTYAYDGFGDLTQSTINGTVATTYTLDVLGRVTESDVVTGETTSWVWDTSPHGLGRLAHTTSPDGTTQDFLYDDLGRLATQTWTIDGATFGFDVHYDPLGRLGALDYPEVAGQPRFSVGYAYNAVGALRDVLDPASLAPYWIAEERNEDDRLLQATLGNGIEQTRGYDDTTGRLTGLFDGAPSATALSLAYDYDDAGHVRHRTDMGAGRAETFDYDDLDRLQRWALGSWISLSGSSSVTATIHATDYGYDVLGNLKTVTLDGALVETNDYGGSAGPHALTSNSKGAYDYDDRGRQEQAPGRSVTYNELDLPRSVTTETGVTSFAYDAGNARVKKEGADGRVITLGGLYEQRASQGKVEHVFYVNGPEGVIAQVVVDGSSGARTTEYLHQDALGSVGAVSNAGGQPSEEMYYEPFGARRDVNGNALASIGGDVPLGFTGDRHDDELGLVDMRGRVYDPALRRFLTPDPHVTDPLWGQSYNRYSYVINDPVNLVDPTGLDWGDPSDPNGPDYPQGCGGGGGFTCEGWSWIDGGLVQTQGSGSSVPKYPSGGPVIGATVRPFSVPVGPAAPATSVVGPGTPAWQRPCVGPTDSGCSSSGGAASWFLRNGEKLQYGALGVSAGAILVIGWELLPAVSAGLPEGAAYAKGGGTIAAILLGTAAAETPQGQEVLREAGEAAEAAGPALESAIESAAPAVEAEAPSVAATPAMHDPVAILKALTEKAVEELKTDPSSATRVLSPPQQLLAANPQLARAMFGKAVEYMVRDDVRDKFSTILEYTGDGRGPDFNSVGLSPQQIFDITTYLGQASHYARPYGSSLVLILYEAPTGWPP